MPEPLNASTPIEFLKGIGPKRAEALAEDLAIRTCGDLLFHLPFRYEDRTRFHRVSETVPGPVQVQLRGTIRKLKEVQQKRGQRLEAEFVDEHGDVLPLVWFKGAKWVARNLPVGQPCVLWGRISDYKGGRNMAHPEVLTLQEARAASALHPVYGSTERLGRFGLNSNGIGKAVQRLITQLRELHGPEWMAETLPDGILAHRGLPRLAVAMEQVHQPADVQAERLGRFRLKFEEFLFLQLLLVQHRNRQTTALPGPAFAEVGEQFNRFYSERIPFELTGAQKRVIREIREDTRNGTHMNRLLQGDVGSGKTMVALLTALLAVDNGCQACIMAPTEILAQQHLASFREMLGDLPIRVELLTGSVKAADRKPILAGLADGSVHLLVGTHAVLEPKVVFHRLGLVVIDEGEPLVGEPFLPLVRDVDQDRAAAVVVALRFGEPCLLLDQRVGRVEEVVQAELVDLEVGVHVQLAEERRPVLALEGLAAHVLEQRRDVLEAHELGAQVVGHRAGRARLGLLRPRDNEVVELPQPLPEGNPVLLGELVELVVQGLADHIRDPRKLILGYNRRYFLYFPCDIRRQVRVDSPP